jgi:hypothetical protein
MFRVLVKFGRLLTTPDRPTLLNWSAVRELGSVGRVHFAFRGHQLPPEKEPSMKRVRSCVIADTLWRKEFSGGAKPVRVICRYVKDLSASSGEGIVPVRSGCESMLNAVSEVRLPSVNGSVPTSELFGKPLKV